MNSVRGQVGGLIALLGCVSACRGAPPADAPPKPRERPKLADITVINQPAPPSTLAKTLPFFVAAGCEDSARPGGIILCPREPAEKAGCNDIGIFLHDELGPLLSKGPLALCLYYPELDPPVDAAELQARRFFGRHIDCGLPARIRYVVADAGSFQGIRTPSEFAARFGPVTSPEEAVAFAAALSGDKAVYSLNWLRRMPAAFVKVKSVTATFARSVPGGFEVHLFCEHDCDGPSREWTQDYLVTTAGVVTATRRELIFDDSEERPSSP